MITPKQLLRNWLGIQELSDQLAVKKRRAKSETNLSPAKKPKGSGQVIIKGYESK